MSTTLLDHETATVCLEDVAIAEPITAIPVKPSRSITVALTFLIGCVTLLMAVVAFLLLKHPQQTEKE